MYLEHFRLCMLPFGITPDTEFFYAGSSSQAALNTLLVAARQGEGFIKITGEVGSGKTLLCRQFMRRLGDGFQVAFVPNPMVQPLTLFLELCQEFGVRLPPLSELPREQREHRVLAALSSRLIELAAQGRHALVCIDEAQAMPLETLESLRLLSNLETERRKLLQVVIFGQPELDAKLAAPSVRQLRQRITFEHQLEPMSLAEMRGYVEHRLAVACHRGESLFSQAATALLHRQTGGTPRLVNIVAHKALLSAYGRGAAHAGVRDVLAGVRDTASVRHLAWRLRGGWALGVVALAGAVGLGMVGIK